jgi:hypothetical protein
VAGRIVSIEKSNDIENRTRNLPACSIVSQPTTLQRSMLLLNVFKVNDIETLCLTEILFYLLIFAFVS